jgi:hypothetical protein
LEEDFRKLKAKKLKAEVPRTRLRKSEIPESWKSPDPGRLPEKIEESPDILS